MSQPEPDSKDAPEETAGTNQPAEADGVEELSAEEQMALYEESLKETDWGHQPC